MSSAPIKPSQVAPGYRLDRYEMLCPIAEGGMASVWIARLQGKRGFQKLVAVKTILPKFAQDPRFERMFLDEAGLAARIEHANVAQVLDLGEEHEVLYLAMELVDGDSLSKLLRITQKKEIPIPPGVVLRILADTCGGLHAAHELRGDDGELLNVVHRDISPQNILVTMNGIAKLIDFGIAKARDRVSEDTSDGVLKGKIHYMAPEQALGRPVDRRADVWAVGAILHHLLSGRRAFDGDNHLATLHLLTSGRPPLPLPPSVHPAVSAVVRRALSQDAERRYATAEDMQSAIEAAMVEAGLVTTTTAVAAFVREHMAERSKKRKEGLDLALSAAAQRDKVAGMLERAGADSASGHDVPSDAGNSVPVVGSTYPTVLQGSARQSQPGSAESSSSSATLGSALASPVPPAGVPRKVGWRASVIASVALLALGVAALGFAARYNGRSSAAAASRPVVAEPVVPPAPPPAEAPSSAWAVVATAPPASSEVPNITPSASAPPPTPRPAPRPAPPKPSATAPTSPPKQQRGEYGF